MHGSTRRIVTFLYALWGVAFLLVVNTLLFVGAVLGYRWLLGRLL